MLKLHKDLKWILYNGKVEESLQRLFLNYYAQLEVHEKYPEVEVTGSTFVYHFAPESNKVSILRDGALLISKGK